MAAFALLLLLRLAMTWVGLYIGLIARSPDSVGVFFPLLMPLTMIANTFVPTQAMPVWLAAVADWNPLSATVGALRELFGNPGMAGPDAAWPVRHAVGMAVAWPILLMAIFIPLSVRQYRRLGR